MAAAGAEKLDAAETDPGCGLAFSVTVKPSRATVFV
jgi:hypothetical protein